jgi:hypothetical protein
VVNHYNDCGRSEIKILDPAIGEGVFLTTIIPLITTRSKSVSLFGIEIDPKVLNIAKVKLNQILQSPADKLSLYTGDFFLESSKLRNKNSYDIIIGNPPHNAKYSSSEWKEIRKKSRFGSNPKLHSESSVFFFLFSIECLKSGGLIGFILPKPIIYSKRWCEFRKILLTEHNVLEVLDFGNQFSGQLQEQIGIIVQKCLPNRKSEYVTGFWNQERNEIINSSKIKSEEAQKVDNFLVGVGEVEMDLIRRIYGRNFKFLDITAFRGISSRFRAKKGFVPLIEKRSFSDGFLFPHDNYISDDIPERILVRQKTPKVIAQRIIPYQTIPFFRFNLKTYVDLVGDLVTQETVINIIPNDSGISLEFLAGLLQSSIVEWWLRHVVYTKRFVTSKDFDNDYIRKIRIPRRLGSINDDYRKLVEKFIKNRKLEDIILAVKDQSNVDKLYTIGRIYLELLSVGQILKNRIKTYLVQKYEYSKSLLSVNNKNSEFHYFKSFYDNIAKNKEKNRISFQTNNEIKSFIQGRYEEIKLLRSYIDDVIYLLYNVTPKERLVIKSNGQ